jgi:hypothetical protein
MVLLDLSFAIKLSRREELVIVLGPPASSALVGARAYRRSRGSVPRARCL